MSTGAPREPVIDGETRLRADVDEFAIAALAATWRESYAMVPARRARE